MSLINVSMQYLSTILPGKDAPQLVKRMHFVSFVGMLRYDLFEGLCVGHAPRKCPICGRWFLTTDARHTKYCGGFASGDLKGRTCRQLGNLQGREKRELADDHPLKVIYSRSGRKPAESQGHPDKNAAWLAYPSPAAQGGKSF